MSIFRDNKNLKTMNTVLTIMSNFKAGSFIKKGGELFGSKEDEGCY